MCDSGFRPFDLAAWDRDEPFKSEIYSEKVKETPEESTGLRDPNWESSDPNERSWNEELAHLNQLRDFLASDDTPMEHPECWIEKMLREPLKEEPENWREMLDRDSPKEESEDWRKEMLVQDSPKKEPENASHESVSQAIHLPLLNKLLSEPNSLLNEQSSIEIGSQNKENKRASPKTSKNRKNENRIPPMRGRQNAKKEGQPKKRRTRNMKTVQAEEKEDPVTHEKIMKILNQVKIEAQPCSSSGFGGFGGMP